MSDRIRLYLDEDAQRTDLIQALRARNIDLLTVSEAHLLGQADAFHLQYATEQARVIFTFNRGDFFRLHTEWLQNEQHHAGIIVSDQLATGVLVRHGRIGSLLSGIIGKNAPMYLLIQANWLYE